MSDEPLSFYKAVRMMRTLPLRYRMLVLYASEFWTDDDLVRSEENGDVPGRPGEMKPTSEPLQ